MSLKASAKGRTRAKVDLERRRLATKKKRLSSRHRGWSRRDGDRVDAVAQGALWGPRAREVA